MEINNSRDTFNIRSLLKWRKEMAKYLKDEDEKSGKNEPNAE